MKYYEIKDVIEADGSIHDKSLEIYSILLKPQQREIFEQIPKGKLNAVSAKEIKEATEIPTKNISSQIKQISIGFPIGVLEIEKGYKKYYRKE